MIVHIPTGITFENRKQAKKVMGQGNYRRAHANGEIKVHELEVINKHK